MTSKTPSLLRLLICVAVGMSIGTLMTHYGYEDIWWVWIVLIVFVMTFVVEFVGYWCEKRNFFNGE